MTEYDLRTRRALRQVTLLEFGFGPALMQRCKLCLECGRATPAQDAHCADCGAVLSEKTSTSPATAAAPAAVWLSPTTRCTARSAGRACRRQA